MTREPFGVRPRSVDEAVAIIGRLLGTILDKHERITALETRIAEQQAEIPALRAQDATLTERLGQSSQNSSRPPSTGPPSSGRPAGLGLNPIGMMRIVFDRGLGLG